MRVALVGNPNVGKTTLLNRLTEGTFEVGNYPGTTVEVKRGIAEIEGVTVEFVDLPGIYGLSAQSKDEKIVVDFLEREKPDLAVVVANASAVERGIYLSLLLKNHGIPQIFVLNMVDEAQKKGIVIDAKALEKALGVPVVETVAVKGMGVDDLKKTILSGGSTPRVVLGSDLIKLSEKIADSVRCSRQDYEDDISDVLIDRWVGIPIFMAVMWMLFSFTFDVSAPIVTAMDIAFSELSEMVASGGSLLASLLGEGIIAGVGSVLVFLPNIAFLFIGVAFLELSGYLPRAVLLLDRVMERFGLAGRSIVPLILGFGCTVPAILATRSIEDDTSRKITILVSPFISCSARLPIYVLLASTFFPESESVVISLIYLMGASVALIAALILRKTVFGGAPEYIMEMPPLRLPKFGDLVMMTWNRTKHFLVKAGTVIVVMAVIIWYLTNFPSPNPADSFAGHIGRIISPLFHPFGWTWEASVAILMGFVAKEVVVETLGILGGGDIGHMFTTSQALSFMVFTLLYTPCMATLAAIRAEAGWKYLIASAILSTVVAYVISYFVFLLAEVIL